MRIKGPLLLASNHPNSFLDAVILDILFKEPIWSLARGDVFKKPFYTRLLTKLKILPVYRTSEGVENLEINYQTFDACKKIFKNDGIVLMFSEGKCINEWHLRPLRKGTARLAISSWQDDIDLTVLPVSINYSSFKRFGKNVFLSFGTAISKEDIELQDADGKKYQTFNDKLRQELQRSVFEIEKTDKQLQKKLLVIKPSKIFRIVLALPALIGLLLNAPLYLPVRYFTKSRTSDTDHHDSVLIALLIFLYPLYLLIIACILFFLTCNWFSFFVFLIFPFAAWAYVQLKEQLD